MNPKVIIASILAFILVSIGIMADVVVPFPGWETLKAKSSDILVVFAGEPASQPPDVNESAPEFCFDVGIGPVLKGTNDVGPVKLLTQHELQRFQAYLVFGHYCNGRLDAFESYRVIQLDPGFDVGSLQGKTLDQQLKILFRSGIKEMNQTIQDDEGEKNRMEQALLQ